MARLIKTLISSSPSLLMCSLERFSTSQSRSATSTLLYHQRPYSTTATVTITKSPFEANILKIIRNEIDYQTEYAPPHEPATTFNSFTVEDRPGEQWMAMKGKLGDNEDIKLEVTMFDGFESVSKLEKTALIQKVYILRRDKMIARALPYMGPDYKNMNSDLKKMLREFLELRGVNNKLCFFLHEYMMNKDRMELIQWLGKVKSYLQK